MDRGVNDSDTIAAVATPPGEGAIGVIRLSGPHAPLILSRIFTGKTAVDAFESHKLYLGVIADEDGATLDQAMAVWMKAPRSFTGEECVELHAHGGRHVLEMILSLLIRRGARLARPGEFSERAFLNGKIDLTQAEAICDLIRAKSDKAARQSLAHVAGHLSATIDALKKELVAIKAHVEAGIDFPDEDITPDQAQALAARLEGVSARIETLIASFERGRVLREGLRVLIIGKPNVGKSSLLNALLGEERAIVHATAGTTRDFIEEHAVLKGVPVRVIDTAGIRASDEAVEREGIRRTVALLDQTDLILALFDGSRPLDAEDEDVMRMGKGETKKIIALKTKMDLPQAWQNAAFPSSPLLPISVYTRAGLHDLETRIAETALGHAAHDSETCVITHVRHKEALAHALLAVGDARQALSRKDSPEFAASDLERAMTHLKEITGEITHDDILDNLFREFCIGK